MAAGVGTGTADVGRRPNSPAPYRGLASFEPDDAEWFFGRTALTTEIVAQVRRLDNAGGGMLMVVGASGSGKSSILRAGVIPALRSNEGPGPTEWSVVLMTPGPNPLTELHSRLSGVGATIGSEGVVAEQDGDGTRLAIFVDQFEEIFTECPDDGQRRAFVEALCCAARAPRGPLLIIGLRADFYAAALSFTDLRDAAQSHQVTVGPMTDEQVREAVTGPARKARIDVEDGLVELLVREVAPKGQLSGSSESTAVLPLLSHALYRTWQEGQGRRLRIADYLRAGGVAGAVAASADSIYNDLDRSQRDLARRLFLGLVHLVPGAVDTRRRLSRAALLSQFDQPTAVAMEDVLDRFVGQRLITADSDTVELSHEALLTAWPQLRTWLDADRTGLIVGRHLSIAAESWEREGHEQSALYRGTRLLAGMEWVADHRDDAGPPVMRFLDASRRQTRRSTRRLYQTIAALLLLVITATTAGLVAINERGQADGLRRTAVRERDEALSRLVASRAEQVRSKDVSLAAQLSLAAYRIAPTTEARASLISSTGTTLAARLRAGDDVQIMPSVALHPGGQVIAAAADNTIRVWDIDRTRRPSESRTLPGHESGTINAITYSPDGHLLAAGGADTTIQLWDTTDPRRALPLGEPLVGATNSIYALEFTPDGRALAAASADGFVRIWDVTDPRDAQRLSETDMPGSGAAKSITFSRDGHTMASGGQSGSVTLWDVTDRAKPRHLASPTGPTKEIGQVVISPDGHLLAAGGRDRNVYLWNIADPVNPIALGEPLTGAHSWINALAFSPDSASLAAAASDTALGVRIWEVASRRLTTILPHAAPVTAVKFSADGTTLATGSNDGIARLWPVRGPTLVSPGLVSSVNFSPDGRTFVVGSTDTQLWNVSDPQSPVPYPHRLPSPDNFSGATSFTSDNRSLAVSHGQSGTFQLWKVEDPAQPTAYGPPIPAHSSQIESLAFSPNGRRLATGAQDHTVRLWDTADPPHPRLLATLTGFSGYVSWVSFSPDGNTLAASSADKTVRLWNITDTTNPPLIGEPLHVGNHYVYCVAFSPDGRTLAVSSADSTIRFWDLADPAKPKTLGQPLRGPTNYVYVINFSPDGQTLAAASTDASVWLWNVADRTRPTPLAAINTPTGALYTVRFHPDNQTIAAGGANQTTWIFNSDPARDAEHVCAHSGESISAAEWNRYVPGREFTPPCPEVGVAPK